MCKILVMPGIKDNTREKSLKFIEAMAAKMGSGSDNDGTGYAALTKAGNLFGERWLKPSEAFKVRTNFIETDPMVEEEFVKPFGGFLTPVTVKEEKKYGSFGLGEKGLASIAAITLHARLSTSGKGFENIHPFVTEDLRTSVIHNGMINNHMSLTKKMSTCDSEVLLHLYEEMKMADDIKKMSKFADKLYGYYACGVFSETSDHTRILDVFKETRADLHGVFIKELETYAFSTSLLYIESVVKELGMNISQTYKVKDEMIVRINPFTGEVIGFDSFSSNKAYTAPYSHRGSYSGYGDDYGAWGKEDEDRNKYGPGKKDKDESTSSGSSNSATQDSPGSVTPIKNGEFLKTGGAPFKGTPSKRDLDKAAAAGEEERRKYIHGLSDDELISNCHEFLNNYSQRESGGIVDANELVKRLRAVHKEGKVDKIVEALCGDLGWEEYLDNTTKEWYFLKRGSN